MTMAAEKSRKEAEEALAESQKNADRLERAQRDLQGILDKSPEAILIRQNDRIAYMNPAFLDCLRVGQDDVVGTSMASLLVDSNDTPTMRTRALLRRSDGQVIVMQLSEPEDVQYQGQSSSLVMGHDITDQDTSLKAKLLLADRMAAVGVLASGIAHEINNPMAYVLGNLEILNGEIEQLTPGMSDDARSELRELLADCLHGSERVTAIVQELRTVAHSEPSGGVADLRQAIESAIKIANNQITHKSAEVDLSIPPSLSAVCGSTSKLSQVFLNLLVNAAQSLCADDRDNAIQIQATQEPAFVRVQVRDTGAGMSPESQRRLFEPFFTTKRIGEGTGLGLYFCRNELTRIGGSIDFESELGVGTTFTVRIPVLPPAN
jgi:signal transduction histidine kinase